MNLPAIAESDQDIVTGWGTSHRRRTGEALHAGLASAGTLDAIKAEIGSFMFSAQYQQQPVPLEGALVTWDWFRTYDEEPGRRETDRIVQSWDTAMTPGHGSDYSACTTWLVRGNHYYLLDVLRAKLDFPSLRSRVVTHARQWGAKILLIESKTSGMSLIQDLRSTPHAPQPIPIKVHQDKATRFAAVTPMIEGGQVFLPKTAPWLEDFRSELLQFPNGRHDDHADSLSQFLNWKRTQGCEVGSYAEPVTKVFDRGSWDDPTPDRDPDIVDLYDDDGANDGYGPY